MSGDAGDGGDRRPGLDLSGVATSDIEHLLSLVEGGKIEFPVTSTGLLFHGLRQFSSCLQELEELDGRSLRSLLAAVLAERRRRAPGLELVWSGPEGRTSGSRDTVVVVRDLFAAARSEVFVGGFVFDHGEEILKPLFESMRDHGVRATLVLDLGRRPAVGTDPRDAAREAIENFLATNWPFGEPGPKIYYDPRGAVPDSISSMHAKCVVVDERRTLLTSANFTDRGQTRNIEAGVLIEDPTFARRLLEQWWGLIGEGLLVEGER